MGGFFGILGILIGRPLFAFVYAVIKDLCERRLRSREMPEQTYDYFERADKQTVDVIEGTDLTTYFSEKRDDTQVYNEMKEKLSKSTSNAKKFLSKFKKK